MTPPPPLNVTGGRVSWYQPVTLKQLVELRDSYPLLGRNEPQYRIVVGNTEIGMILIPIAPIIIPFSYHCNYPHSHVNIISFSRHRNYPHSHTQVLRLD